MRQVGNRLQRRWKGDANRMLGPDFERKCANRRKPMLKSSMKRTFLSQSRRSIRLLVRSQWNLNWGKSIDYLKTRSDETLASIKRCRSPWKYNSCVSHRWPEHEIHTVINGHGALSACMDLIHFYWSVDVAKIEKKWNKADRFTAHSFKCYRRNLDQNNSTFAESAKWWSRWRDWRCPGERFSHSEWAQAELPQTKSNPRMPPFRY